jgi:hypothetical protein
MKVNFISLQKSEIKLSVIIHYSLFIIHCFYSKCLSASTADSSDARRAGK